MSDQLDKLVKGLKTLQKLGYARIEGDRLIIIVERCDIGEAFDNKGRRALAVGFDSDLLGLQVHFLITDRTLLRIARRIIDEILEPRSYM